MVAHAIPPRMSREDYLDFERNTEMRHEYHNGVIVAMSGVSPNHDQISLNITVDLGTQLRNKPCRLFSSNIRVYAEACNCYYYPDASVACNPEYEKIKGVQSLANPAF